MLSDFRLPQHVTQNAALHKAAVSGTRGMVVSQSRVASEIGLAVLDAGGNAADAAVAVAFTLASAEPWNSGLGGIGFGLIRRPGGEVDVLDFGPVAPLALEPDSFPTTGRVSADIFAWPEVVDARNVNGPLSFCVPSAVAGYGLLHETFGRLGREAILAPAVSVARRGLAKDWFATIKLSQSAAVLRNYKESARIYLPNDMVPIPPEQGAPGFLPLGGLAETIERIRVDGYDAFYRGDLSALLLNDLKGVGSLVTRQDLAACEARLYPAASVDWRGAGQVYLPGNLTAAPAFAAVVRQMATFRPARTPDASWYTELSAALRSSFARRLEGKTDQIEPVGTCTSHLSVMDAEGMTVSLTTTLLGTMGSRQVLPATGILMNNGAMWFDPRPGMPNSVAGGKRPLTNMLPAIFVSDDGGRVLSVGASGGRRIMASVYQMLSHVLDFGMDLDAAAHQPRIDVSSADRVGADRRLDEAILDALAAQSDAALDIIEHGPVPLNFACPSAILRDGSQTTGVSDTMSPWSYALAQ